MSDPNQPAEPLPVVPESSVPEESPRWRVPHNLVVEDAVHAATSEIRKVLGDVKTEAANVLANVRELAAKSPTLQADLSGLIDEFTQLAVNFTNSAFATLEKRLTDHASTVEQIIGNALSSVHAKVDQILTAAQATPAPAPTPAPEAAPASGDRAASPPPASSTEAPLSPELVAREAENLELKEFPTLAEFVAEGFYADTYEYQKAQWQAKRDKAAATQAPANSEENAPSDPATGASPGSA